MPSRQPRRISDVLGAVQRAAAPRTPLASVQLAWPEVVGERIASVAEPVSERDGRVTVACTSAVWAQELDLMADDLLRRLGEAMDSPPTALRFQVRPG